ncbi:MAG: hypothetical protein JRN08_05375 [Nitrososphaerota archaeon]|nr:hypothetical protein [Nitrososphaerota archaeon]
MAQVQEGVQKVLAVEQSTAEEDSDSKEGLRLIRRHNRAQLLKDELGAALEDLDAGNPWVAQKREDDETSYLELTPVLSQRLLSRRLWLLGSRLVILSTGTILDTRRFLWEAGLPEEGFKHLRPPSNFPPGNAPIFTRPSVSLTYQNQERNLPVALGYLQEIMDRHPGQRGLVHTVSYRMQRQIYDSLPERYRVRVVIHDRGGDRNRTLGNWKKDTSRSTVLLSVAMEEGVDLKGELAEWQVILKCPWENTKDRRNVVRRGMQDGWQGYAPSPPEAPPELRSDRPF